MFETVSVGRFEHLQSDLPSRTPTVGPEYTLAADFCDERLAPTRAGESVTVFVEPKLHGAFPDIVVVYWDPSVAARWPQARCDLTIEELKHLHRLQTLSEIAVDELRTRVGARSAMAIVQRLVDAKVATYKNGALHRVPLRETFAVRRLVAIEAKISNWRTGLRQAFLNSWYASESFLLLPAIPVRSKILVEARELGIGLLSGAHTLVRPALRSKRAPLPTSYASWLFNEWVWRYCAKAA